jgi:hypothetical protein
VHGIDAAGQVVIRRQLKRRYVLAFFHKLASVPGGHRGLCLIASLVASARGARPYGEVNAAGLREALLADPKGFRSGRNFSARIGLVRSSIQVEARIHGSRHRPWLTALLARRPSKVAAIALANKIARMVWAMMARGEHYKEPVALAA